MMLSRVAENLYWLARYVERAENTARLISVNAYLLLDLPKGVSAGWEPVIQITGGAAEFHGRYKHADERSVVRFLIGDSKGYGGSIRSSLELARENCRTVRDILPRMAWEQLTELNLYAKENAAEGLTKTGRQQYLKRIIAGSQAFVGMLNAILLRDEGHQFLRIGRNLERADMTSRIIDVRSASLITEDTPELRPFETIQWMSVLKSLTAYQMYRRATGEPVGRREVLAFLFKDVHFPRSVLHCLHIVEECLGNLNAEQSELRPIRRVDKQVALADLSELRREILHEFVDELQLAFVRVHNQIAKRYFPPPI